MAETRKEKLKFEVTSLDRSKKTIEYVKDAEALSEDLEKIIAKKYPGTKVTIRRDEGLPIGPLIQHLIVSIDWHLVKEGVEKGATAFATTQILTLLKDKVQNLFAKPITGNDGTGFGNPARTKTAAKAPTKKAAKTTTKKIATKNAKGKAKP
jgi:hypothetical protein